MKTIYKNIGETPLEALEKLRQTASDLKHETLSYIGRLDPMAEGEMLVLVGKEENQKRDDYLKFDKEYVAEFLIGFETDTGDLLGIVQNFSGDKDFSKKADTLTEKIVTLPEKLLQITHQKYPWFSSKHVFGRALFDWFKSGRKEEIERPSKDITIYSASLLESRTIGLPELQKHLIESINKVKGDFRQAEILDKWQGILEVLKSADSPIANSPTSNFPISDFPIFSLKLKVSTGTYIRGLTEEIKNTLGQPVVLFSLKRTKIFLDSK
jgi:tRNA U55 pseudouridine synthase TruB